MEDIEQAFAPVVKTEEQTATNINLDHSNQDGSPNPPDLRPRSVSTSPIKSEDEASENQEDPEHSRYEQLLRLLHHFRHEGSDSLETDRRICDQMIALVETKVHDNNEALERKRKGKLEHSLGFLVFMMAMLGWGAALLVWCISGCVAESS